VTNSFPHTGAPLLPSRHLESGSFVIDVHEKSIWITRRASAQEHVSFEQLKEMHAIDSAIQQGAFGAAKFKILSAESPNLFCLGGDLALFLECIDGGDREALTGYALAATKSVWINSSGFGARQIGSIAVVRGEAQGGGFEVALSCDVLVAERGAYFGFPETIFGLFPGMGAELLLATRVDAGTVKRITTHARRYSAEFLFEIGIVDVLSERGRGLETAAELSLNPDRLGQFQARISLAREIRYSSLIDVVEQWVEQALRLPQRSRKAMRVLLGAQEKRRERNA